MFINKVSENVEYYVIDSKESPDTILSNIDNNVVEMRLPTHIKPINKEYLFVYVDNAKLNSSKDYTFVPGVVKFTPPIKAEQIIVKLYTIHDHDVSKTQEVL